MITPDKTLTYNEEDFMPDKLMEFANESNRIEGIFDIDKDYEHTVALRKFLELDGITITDLSEFVKIIQPHAHLRTEPHHRVYIGGHEAMKPQDVMYYLEKLLIKINSNISSPWQAHCEYEMIHPFMDGNGRSGRAVWLWMMVKFHGWNYRLGFKHVFYYQTLQAFKKGDV
jgi:Fic family protein